MQDCSILIVDDHPLFRKGIISVIEDSGIFSKIIESSTIKETFEILEKEKVDFIILDLNLPDGDGVDIIDKISRGTGIPILVITTYNSSIISRDVFKKGAKGYIAKENVSDNLIDAVKTILLGGNYLDATDNVFENDDKYNTELYFGLTNAEKIVFKMLAEGKTPKEIAYETGKSIKTVENQRGAIMKKLNFKTEVELIKLALKLNIIDI